MAGATICKCLNRAMGTSLAGFLAVGVHWVASQSGEKFEPIIMGAAVFLLASAATFSRFIPAIKARFDYGAMIFILTFCLVSVSGYRVEKLLVMAQERLSTIIIGTALCILTSMLVFPIWAGNELHLLITRNMDKLANSLDCCVTVYLSESGSITSGDEDLNKRMPAYKCVLNSKATEDSMAAFARWEPAHGRFSFQHPWKQYLKIGASMRSCAYCIETLNSCINLENQAPEFLKNHVHETCLRVSSKSSSILRELAKSITTMTLSSTIDISIEEVNNAVVDLQNDLEALPGLLISPPVTEAKTAQNEKAEPILTTTITPLVDIIPLVTVASLLIEITGRIEDIVDAVEELSDLAQFKPASDEKPKQNQSNQNIVPDQQKDNETMKALQRV
ncbi:unnamed protein product [Ilex paraguariensis]|uniref:Aluminum-activated malate transporter 10 n=1 Tax=Ilex paraguariensis TaxID=185542 RepID=A0ABC8TIX4_9AQUA